LNNGTTTYEFIRYVNSQGCSDESNTVTITIYVGGIDTIMASNCANAAYILPSGATAIGGGTFFDTIPGFNCDSLIVAILTEIPLPTGSTSVTICPGESYILPGGGSVSSAGTYIDTIPAFACDSIVTVTINQDPYNYVTRNPVICANGVYTLPGGGLVSASGTYQDTIGGPACDTVFTINLSVTALPTGVVNDTICDGTPYTLPGGGIVTTGGIYIDTIAGFSCDSVVFTVLAANPVFGLFAASHTNYYRVDPYTGAILNTYALNPFTIGWINGSFTVHQRGHTVYWLSENLRLQSLNLITGVQSSTATAISTLPFFWTLRYYNGHIYTLTVSGDNDKMLVRINPATGALDGTFPGIEINGTAGMELSGGSSPVINPYTGIYYMPTYGNKLLAFNLNTNSGTIVNLTGYAGTPPSVNLLEINEVTGVMYALSGFNTLVSITVTGPATANVASIKTLTSGAGFTNPMSAFDSENELYIFQAEYGCGADPLIAVDVNTGQEWCSDPPGIIFTQMEFLNCTTPNTLRIRDPGLIDKGLPRAPD
jgi:hypothetical protein